MLVFLKYPKQGAKVGKNKQFFSKRAKSWFFEILAFHFYLEEL